MLENLIQLVASQAQDAIVNNNAIPNEHNQTAINEVGNGIQQALSSQLSAGNLAGIMQMFTSGGNQSSLMSNPIAQSIISQVAGNLAAKVGVSPAVATGIASSLLPSVLSQFTQQAADPNNSQFDMNGIMQAISGGQQGGGVDFNQVLNQLQGGQGQQGGGVDIASIAQQFLGGGGQQGGGIADMIGGFFKK